MFVIGFWQAAHHIMRDRGVAIKKSWGLSRTFLTGCRWSILRRGAATWNLINYHCMVPCLWSLCCVHPEISSSLSLFVLWLVRLLLACSSYATPALSMLWFIFLLSIVYDFCETAKKFHSHHVKITQIVGKCCTLCQSVQGRNSLLVKNNGAEIATFLKFYNPMSELI